MAVVLHCIGPQTSRCRSSARGFSLLLYNGRRDLFELGEGVGRLEPDKVLRSKQLMRVSMKYAQVLEAVIRKELSKRKGPGHRSDAIKLSINRLRVTLSGEGCVFQPN